jgi:ribosome-binding factor A
MSKGGSKSGGGGSASKGGGPSKGGKGSKASSAAPSQRMLRVAELIRHKLAEMLSRGDIHDDVLARAVVTVPEVRLSPDLKLATVYIMPLGGKDTKAVIAALAQNKSFIRSEIAHAVNLKYAPDLRFLVDETFDEAERISRIMNTPKVRKDIAGE